MDTIIFDFDGTLCDISHRLHHIKGPQKNWDAFYADCDKDVPKPHIIAMLNASLEQGYNVEIWTGRTEAVLEKSHKWLYKNGVPGFRKESLCMRPPGNYTPDHILKKEWLDEFMSYNAYAPLCVFEDRQRVIDMWKDNNVLCFPVDPWKEE